MDCFFAAIEMRDHPELAHLPLAVGGDSPRSVLSTCNYQARKFGLHSAMPSHLAKKLCPNLIIINGSSRKYKEASDEIHEIFQAYTDQVQPLSLDEAFLDVTNNERHQHSATLLSLEIKEKIYLKTKLRASAGIAPNKFLAKIASDWKKPNGHFTISPKQIQSFIKTLPVRNLPGVGPVTEKKLYAMNIKNCSDLQRIDEHVLTKRLGSFSKKLKDYSFGIDHSEVKPNSIRKSISIERTFHTDQKGFHDCRQKITQLEEELGKRIKKWKIKKQIKDNCLKSVFIKMKTYDFQTITIERSCLSPFSNPIWNEQFFNNHYQQLIDELCLEGLNKVHHKKIRLLGLGLKLSHKKLDTEAWHQLDLFSNGPFL